MAASHKKGKILVFSAASGAGKTSLLDHLRTTIPELVYSISATTRPPRPHEQDKVHYFFMSEEEFKKKIKAQEFAEWAQVHGNYYGTPKSFINENINAGRHIIMDIDVYGKVIFDKVYPDTIGIFIEPPSKDVLEQRLRDRKTDSVDVIAIRLANAEKETEFAKRHGKYEYTLINDDFEIAKKQIVALVRTIVNA